MTGCHTLYSCAFCVSFLLPPTGWTNLSGTECYWFSNLLHNLFVVWLFKKFPAAVLDLEGRICMTVCASASHYSQSSHPHTPFIQDLFQYQLTYAPRSPKSSFFFRFPDQNYVACAFLSLPSVVAGPAIHPQFDHRNNIWRTVQILKYLPRHRCHAVTPCL
jgi:hypothetical protein